MTNFGSFPLRHPPPLVVVIFAPPDARPIIKRYDFLCNGTHSIRVGGAQRNASTNSKNHEVFVKLIFFMTQFKSSGP